jgi:hypothetical protein
VESRDQELVVAIAEAIVRPVDPAVVRYVAADAEAYFADPRRALARAGAKKPLGSGLEDFLPTLGVAAHFVAGKAVDVYLEATIKKTHRGVFAFVKRRWGRHNELRNVPAFTDEQVARVVRSVAEAATAHGLDAAGADALAVAVRDRLPRKVEPGGGGN